MFSFWGYLIWLLLAARLFSYVRWLWRNGRRLGAAGVIFLTLGTLAALLVGSFCRNGPE